MSRTAITSNFKMCWFPNEGCYWARKLQTGINLVPFMPDEDKTFSGSFVLDWRIWWRQVHTLYREKIEVATVMNKTHSIRRYLQSTYTALQIPACTSIVLPISWSLVRRSMMLLWQPCGLCPEWRETGFITADDPQAFVEQVGTWCSFVTRHN